jgi:hypothetical protein
LVDAAPSGDFAGLLLLLSNFERNCRLPDHENLLVLHVLSVIVAMECCLNEVLYLSLGALAYSLIMPVHRRWQAHRYLEIEIDFVAAWSEHAINRKNRLFVLKKFLAHFDSFPAFNLSVAFLFHPKSGEGSLLLSFDFDLDELCVYFAINVDENLAFHVVSRFVEGVLSLHLYFATFKVAAIVGKEKH